MNRRSFLTSIAAALASATLDPEKMLWVPGAKTISIPSASERPLSIDEFNEYFIKTPLAIMKQNLTFQRALNRRYSELYEAQEHAPGETVFVRIPQRFR